MQTPRRRSAPPPSPPLSSRLRRARQARGLTQEQLAAAVGVTRQAVIAMEQRTYVPNTLVALRLARVLGCRVEDLFAEPSEPGAERVELAEPAGPGRLAVARVRDRLVGYPLAGGRLLHDGFEPADAVAGEDGAMRFLLPPEELARTALLLGCDPAFGLLAAHVARRRAGRLHCLFASSRAALAALGLGATHLAGSHLHVVGGDDDDLAHARAALAATGGVVVAFAEWEQGLMVAPGNPLAIRGVADLAGGELRFVNRETGSGSRAVLDAALARAAVPASAVRGYGTSANGHLDAARRVAAGAADAAIGLRAVADACGCGFVPLVAVRCDLAVPADLLDHPAVAAALDALGSADLRAELAGLPGYDARRSGDVLAQFPRPS